MRSRAALVALFICLSGLLAFLPLVDATASGSGQATAPAAEAAAQNKAKPKQKQQKKKRVAKNKNKKQRQQRNKQQKRQKSKQQRNRQQRAQQRADDVTQVSTPGQQVSAARLPGGRLPGSARRVAQAQNPGERYIVLFRNDRVNARVLTTNLDQLPGVIPTNIYEHAVKGFAGYLTPAARQELEQDPRVESVTKDRKRSIAVQTLPRGINRVDADVNSVADIDSGGPGVDVDIAVIDTGTDLGHPDLNVFAYLDCVNDDENDPNWGWDLNGHGTHVAGTAAAIDNDDGVVGVAPGARIWSFRVLDEDGNGFDSDIIDCMDAVAFNATEPFEGQTIDVANMSLGGEWPEDRCGIGDPFNDSVCGMVNAGVTVVVAAGNDFEDAANFNPANIDAVITVSALADSNGQPGGSGPNYSDDCTNSEQDDSFADFSNFGADVDIAAPGVGILSTFPTYINDNKCAPSAGVGYEIYPGTSMASPHVAGAAGLLLSISPNLTPEQVKGALQASRENVAMAGDPDGINEGILDLGASGPPPPPPGDNAGPALTVRGPGQGRVGRPVTIRANASDPSGIARVELYLCKRGCRKVAQDASAPYSFTRRHGQEGQVRYKVRAIDRVGNFTEKPKNINVRSNPR